MAPPQVQPEVVTTPQLVRQVVPTPEAIEAARLRREAQTTGIRQNIARQIADGTARILAECMDQVAEAWNKQDELNEDTSNV